MVIWHTAPEIISSLVVGVLLLSTGNVHLRLTAREKVFQYTLVIALAAMVYNLFLDLFIQLSPPAHAGVTLFLYTFLYLIYPLALGFLIWYIMLFIGEKTPDEHKRRENIFTSVYVTLYILYTILILVNLKTGWVFSVTQEGSYTRQALNSLPFFLGFTQILIISVYLLIERSYIDRITLYLFRWLPVLSLVILILQMIVPDVFLAGTAISIALLSVYLTFQTRKLSVDDLTQLPNRMYFLSFLSRSVKRKNTVSVLVISLDDFKTINDTYSLKKGDAILLALSSFLAKTFPDSQVYRYSGDEFAISLPEGTGAGAADLIRNRLEEPWMIGGIAAILPATILEITFPCTKSRDENPLIILDYALRIAKTQHKGRTLIFDEDLLHAIRKRRTIVNSLHQSLTRESLRVVFQPIVELPEGRPVMYEALLRMNDSNLKEIGPGEFIPIAEELGIIDQLTLYVVSRVCAIQAELMRDDKEVPAIAINFSASHFSNKKFIKEIQNLIAFHTIPKGKIFFEVTEHTFASLPFEEIRETMDSFLDYGVQFNLDDFGTGYSNLAHILNLPFRFIKIDKSLLWREKKGKSEDSLLISLATLLQELGFDIIIEGVETEAQAATLHTIEIPKAQGFYFSLPLEYEEFSRTSDGNISFPLD